MSNVDRATEIVHDGNGSWDTVKQLMDAGLLVTDEIRAIVVSYETTAGGTRPCHTVGTFIDAYLASQGQG